MKKSRNDFGGLLEYVFHVNGTTRVEIKTEGGKTVPVKFYCPVCKRYVLPDKKHCGLSIGGTMMMAILGEK